MQCSIVSHKSNVRIYDHMHALQNMDSRLPSLVAAIPWQIIVSKHLTCQKKQQLPNKRQSSKYQNSFYVLVLGYSSLLLY